MKTQLIAAVLVAVSAAVAAPAFASETTVTRAQVRAELVQLQQAGYVPGRANDPHYPDDLQAALTRLRTNGAVAADTATSGYGSDAAAATQSGSRAVTRIAERSIYFRSLNETAIGADCRRAVRHPECFLFPRGE